MNTLKREFCKRSSAVLHKDKTESHHILKPTVAFHDSDDTDPALDSALDPALDSAPFL
jgi:hypothetical protein